MAGRDSLHFLASPRRVFAATAALAGLFVLPTVARSQAAGFSAPPFSAPPFSVRADWLQANATLTRSTLPSNAAAIAWEGRVLGFSLGFMRIARDLSTIEGGTAGVDVAYRIGRFRIALGATGLAGVAMASRDTAGYQYVGAGGAAGHMPKFDYSRSSANGGGGTLTIEYDFLDHLGLRVTGGTWTFSGNPLGNEGSRTTIGAGLTVPFGKPAHAVRRAP
jgi:hypothetical protein